MIETPHCPQCTNQGSLFGAPRGVAFVRKKSSTGYDIGAKCLDCDRWLESRWGDRRGIWVPHQHFTAQAIERMHWIDTTDREQPCTVCETSAMLESHHLAPRALFGVVEAERWPKVDVCRECHRRWHETTGTPFEGGGD